MKAFSIFTFMLMGLIIPALGLAQFNVGSSVSSFELSGDDGGKLDGSGWSSKELAGKVSVLFYVDPDEKDLNEEFGELLKEKNYSKDVINYVAIINMEATALPNFLIASSLKVKQRKYTSTLYVKDYNKKLVKAPGFADDNYNILILNPAGKILFYKKGKMSSEEIAQAIGLIEGNFPAMKASNDGAS